MSRMPTTVEVGADRPLIVRLALGWMLIIYAMGRRTSKVCTSHYTMNQSVLSLPLKYPSMLNRMAVEMVSGAKPLR